jgi:hypothetical protein
MEKNDARMQQDNTVLAFATTEFENQAVHNRIGFLQGSGRCKSDPLTCDVPDWTRSYPRHLQLPERFGWSAARHGHTFVRRSTWGRNTGSMTGCLV